MLNCQICTTTTDVLAHQVRGESILAVCLDCADRYYQDQLTKSLIEAEKVGAQVNTCDFCFKPAKYTAQFGRTKGQLLCKDHIEVYEWALTSLGLVGA